MYLCTGCTKINFAHFIVQFKKNEHAHNCGQALGNSHEYGPIACENDFFYFLFLFTVLRNQEYQDHFHEVFVLVNQVMALCWKMVNCESVIDETNNAQATGILSIRSGG